jgi:hypothetical protein
MPSADQVPVKSTHSMMPWPKWLVLIAGSTGAALRAVRLPNRYVTPDVWRDFFTPRAQGDRYLRSLFTAGALAVIRYAKIHGTGHRPWLTPR